MGIDREHAPSPFERMLSMAATVIIHAAIFAAAALSSGSSQPEAAAVSEESAIFCRYIESGRLFRTQVRAKDWQTAEEDVCGSQYRGIRLGALFMEGARLVFDGDGHGLLLAQRESCSCSDESRVPVLQDIGIVEAPRLGAETRKTALPRIINAPEPSKANTVTTQKSPKTPEKKEKTSKKPTLDDLLSAASAFDEARPVSVDDPGGSADGSRLSKSATGKGDPYLQKIKAKLDNTMNAPASIPKPQLQKLSAKIWIKVGDNGTVWAWDFVKKSGNAAFDKMIEMTIKQYMMGGTLKFAAPPEQWRLQMIPINVEGRDI